MPLKLRKPVKARKRDEQRPIRITGNVKAAITAADDTPDADGKPKLRTFEGVAYTGAVMEPGGWYGRIIVDLAGVRVPKPQRPVFRQHDHEQIVGHTAVEVGDEGIKVKGVFSGEKQHTDKVLIPADNGFEWELSIGADPVRTEFLEAGEESEVNGLTVTGPLTISRETILGETSFVPLGADGDTSVTVSASKRVRAMQFKAAIKALKAAGNVRAGKYSDEDIDKMSDDEAKAALKKCMADDEAEAAEDEDEEEGEDEEEEKPKAKARSGRKPVRAASGGRRVSSSHESEIKASRKAFAAEEARIGGIKALAAKYPTGRQVKLDDGKTVDVIAHAIGEGWSAQDAEVLMLRAERPGAGVGRGPHLHFGSKPELAAMPEEQFAATLECAVLHAGRHQMPLADDDFYRDAETKMRRVPAHTQAEAQRDFKTRYTDQVQQAAHTMFQGRAGLQQVLVAGARRNGYTGSDKVTDGNLEDVLRFATGWAGRGGFQAEGNSTLSIANILANVQNKFALGGYLFTEQAWREIATIRNNNDFKPSKSINLLGDTRVKPIGDNGQLEDASLSDQAFSNQVDQYGRMLTIGRKPIINDDLGILTSAPMKMGQGAGDGLNNLFWTVFNYLASITADDGAAFWANTGGAHTTTPPAHQRAANANLLTGGTSALSSAGLALAKAMFDNQIDPNGRPLGFDAQVPVLLFPPELWLPAMELVDPSAIGLVYGGSTATKQPNVNMWKGRLKPVMSRFLNKTLTDIIAGTSVTAAGSTTAWYTLFAAIAGVSVIEVAFLDGIDTPTVQTAGPDWNFSRLGISMRVIFDYGVNPQSFRAGVKAAGV